MKARAVFLSLVLALIAVAGWAADIPGDVPGVNLPFAVEVSPPEITFHVDGPPSAYPASSPVTVAVRSGFAAWTLYMQASPLVEVTRGWALPASRIRMEGGLEEMMAEEAGPVSLGQPILIAAGEFTGPNLGVEAVINLSLQSQWSDRPGTYQGQVVLTFLATP